MHLPLFAVRAGIELKTTFWEADFSRFSEKSSSFLMLQNVNVWLEGEEVKSM